MVALKNMKEFTQKISVIDMGEQDMRQYHEWFHVTSAQRH